MKTFVAAIMSTALTILTFYVIKRYPNFLIPSFYIFDYNVSKFLNTVLGLLLMANMSGNVILWMAVWKKIKERFAGPVYQAKKRTFAAKWAKSGWDKGELNETPLTSEFNPSHKYTVVNTRTGGVFPFSGSKEEAEILAIGLNVELAKREQLAKE